MTDVRSCCDVHGGCRPARLSRRRARRARTTGAKRCAPGSTPTPSTILSKVARDRQPVGCRRSAISCAPTRRSASTTMPKRAARNAATGPAARSSGIRSAKCCSLRGKRAPAESAFVRADAEHAPDSLTAALNLAVLHYDRGERDRAMKEFDHFIDVYNATAGARSHERRARRRRDGGRVSRRRRSAAVQGCAQGVRPRGAGRSDERRRQGQARRAVPAQVQLRRRAEDVRRRASSEPARSARAARRGAAAWRATGRLAAIRCSARRSNVNPDYVDARTLHAEMLLGLEDYARSAAGHRSRAQGESRRRANARRRRGDQVSDARPGGFEAMRQRALALNPGDARAVHDARRTVGERAAVSAGRGLREAGASRSTPKDWRGVERARHESAAPRPDRRRARESRDVVQGRSVQRVGEEHARSARHIQEL